MVTPGTLRRRGELYYQLGTSIAAGLPLIKAIEMASNNRALSSSRGLLLEIIEHLRQGHTLSDSFLYLQGQIPGQPEVSYQKSRHRLWMPEFDIALLSVGEQTGRLDIAFKTLSEFYVTRAQIIRDTLSNLALSILNLNMLLLICPLGFLVDFVLGLFNNEYAKCIPFLIEKAIVFGGMYGTTFLLIFLCQGTHGEKWRAIVESVFRCVPILRTALKYLAIGRMSAALEALINAGVPMDRSWDFAVRASGSPLLKRKVLALLPEMENGLTPAEMVNQIAYIPDMFRNLYHTGEISGQLDESLTRLRVYYQEEGFRLLKVFTRILAGVIYAIVAISIAFFVIGFYMHLYGGMLQSF
jgi:type II secretory pathway component PulF